MRRKVAATPQPHPGPVTQRRAVDAFLTAARGGDLDGPLAVLDPEVVHRCDAALMRGVRGAEAVAGMAPRP